MNLKGPIISQFFTALTDCFKDEDDRDSNEFSAIDPGTISGNDMILAMFAAFRLTVKLITDFDGDLLDFINVLNHLLLQEAREDAVRAVIGDEVEEVLKNGE